MSINGREKPKVAVLHSHVLGATRLSFPLFRCPNCLNKGYIDEDQFHGLTSIVCEVEDCGYHETRDWSRE